MKPILIIIALSSTLFAQQFAAQEPKSREFKYSLTGEAWLRVIRVNDAKDRDMWHPSFTVIEATYKPVVKKEGDTWIITFRSPNLPSPDLP